MRGTGRGLVTSRGGRQILFSEHQVSALNVLLNCLNFVEDVKRSAGSSRCGKMKPGRLGGFATRSRLEQCIKRHSRTFSPRV